MVAVRDSLGSLNSLNSLNIEALGLVCVLKMISGSLAAPGRPGQHISFRCPTAVADMLVVVCTSDLAVPLQALLLPWLTPYSKLGCHSLPLLRLSRCSVRHRAHPARAARNSFIPPLLPMLKSMRNAFQLFEKGQEDLFQAVKYLQC